MKHDIRLLPVERCLLLVGQRRGGEIDLGRLPEEISVALARLVLDELAERALVELADPNRYRLTARGTQVISRAVGLVGAR